MKEKAQMSAHDGSGAVFASASQDTKPIPYSHAWEKEDEHPIDLMLLKPFIQSPRDLSSALVQEMAQGAGLFSRRKQAIALSKAPLVFACVVAHDERLLQPGRSRYANAVICYALDEGHRLNINWLSRVLDTLNKPESTGAAKNERKITRLLEDMTAFFSISLPPEMSGGAEAWLATIRLEDQSLLPHNCLPTQKILPFLIVESGRRRPLRRCMLIPKHYYEIISAQ